MSIFLRVSALCTLNLIFFLYTIPLRPSSAIFFPLFTPIRLDACVSIIESEKSAPEAKVFTDVEISNIVDSVFKENDENLDGYIEYIEFKRRQAISKTQQQQQQQQEQQQQQQQQNQQQP
ncbi:hypothetical protein RRG08_050005 [Elysia crispata]|uniref:EF-hand domain-containing protein n=1 Tax=Elysia crispata TaxID=231223 RepID=A0AAE1BB17_9GAST|nr:hypothetical protein RRG08_050005 [Elysia crispata]